MFMSEVVPGDMVTLGFAEGAKELGSSGDAVAVLLRKDSFSLHLSLGNVIRIG